MTGLADLESIDPNTTADAVEVDANFDALTLHINNQLIRRNGDIGMAAPLLLDGDPSQDDHAANKGYVDAVIPVGSIFPFGGQEAPDGDWLLCNGAERSIATYPKLHAVLLLNYGTPSVVGNFKLPDLRGRLLIGQFTSSSSGRFDVVGHSAGSWTVPVPTHTHTINHNHASFNTGAASATHTHAIDINTTIEGDHSHTGEFTLADGGTGGYFARRHVDSGGFNAQLTNAAGDHYHSVEGTTVANTVGHVHPVDTPLFSGPSGEYDKEVTYDPTTGAILKSKTELIPPYLVINFIIKADPT